MRVSLDLMPCCGQRSGVGTYVFELARRLAGDTDLQVYGNVFDFLGRNGVENMVEGVNVPLKKNIWMPYGPYLEMENKKPVSYSLLFPYRTDVTHFFNFIVPRKIRGKVINTIHDLTYVYFPETMDETNRKRITSNIEYSVKRADRIVTNSQFVKKEVTEFFNLDKDLVHVIYPSGAVSEKNLGMEYLEKKWKINDNFILYLGNIEPRKNLVRLIEAFELLKAQEKDVQLVMAGGGWKSSETLEKAEASPYKDDIIFTGYVSDDEKSTLYRNARVFVFPSLYEGFGMPLLEAMKCRVPLVCSDEASLPEVGGDCARYVKAKEPESIADGIYDMLTNREKANDLVVRGFERAKLFSWDNSAAKLKRVYRMMK